MLEGNELSNQKLITVGEAAKILCLSADGVRLLERQGKLPAAVKVGNGQRLFDRAVVKQLKRVRSTRPEPVQAA
jgi:excisionase family DNA binding protein